MLEYIVVLLILVAIYLYSQLYFYKKFGLQNLKKAISQKKPLLILESPTGYYLEVPKNIEGNLAFTKKRDVIILSPGTLKPCRDLGNSPVAHGDLYLSCTVPIDLAKFIKDELKKNKTEEEIADLLEEISTSGKIPKKYLEKVENEEKRNIVKRIYKTYSFDNIKNFLNTGLNRVLLKRQLITLIELNRLEKMFGGRDWMRIVIPLSILIIIIVVAISILAGQGILPLGGGLVTPRV
ncbi:MAG TPA: hypothetical protein EYP89_01560 [Candidatus Omnitrophica bacterium]|nr:hypothetical protein [Candidatus Omnitrophota bacterium]